MKKYMEILQKCPLFFDVEGQSLLKMLDCLDAKTESFDKKYTIITEGSPAKYIGIVLKGSAQITRTDYYGNRSILSEIMPSELFCEAFACTRTESIPVSVIANEPCEVMLIDSAHILSTCQKSCSFHRQLIFNLMMDLAEKTLMFHRKIEIISKRTTREKLMTYLMLYSKKAGKNSFDIPFDRQELADYLEVERSGLSAEIGKLRNEGVIRNRKSHFELL